MIGQRIAEERRRLGLSQADFAKAVGVSISTQKRYEIGDASPGTNYLLSARKIGVDLNYLLDVEARCDEIVRDAYRKQGAIQGDKLPCDPSELEEAISLVLEYGLLMDVIEGLESALQSSGLSMTPAKKAKSVVMLYRASKASGKVDRLMIEEVVTLAAG